MLLDSIANFLLNTKNGNTIYIGNISKYFAENTIKRVNVFKIIHNILEKLKIKTVEIYYIEVSKDVEAFSQLIDNFRRLYYEEMFKLCYSSINNNYKKADYYLGLFDKNISETSNINIHYPLYNKNNFDISVYEPGQLLDVRALPKMTIRNYTVGTVIFDVYDYNIKKRYIDKKFFRLNEEDIDKWKPILIESFEEDDISILINYVVENNFYNEEMRSLLFKSFTYENDKISFDTLDERKEE